MSREIARERKTKITVLAGNQKLGLSPRAKRYTRDRLIALGYIAGGGRNYTSPVYQPVLAICLTTKVSLFRVRINFPERNFHRKVLDVSRSFFSFLFSRCIVYFARFIIARIKGTKTEKKKKHDANNLDKYRKLKRN